ncbi:adenine deaminase [Terribacillus saccharophilus]|uniref:Adenine deaminase n=1 Tax=Terribacillus saccharophilus TaxID=361277 RepID=A0A075LP47_9BACI|nr:adenine deaminase [Terribacillus goriensis]AIF67762.1 adenine deaminase [Terribacillus goriensis]
MNTVGKRTKLFEAAKRLGEVALGKRPADLIIRDGVLVNVFTGELLEHTDVVVSGDRIALVGKALKEHEGPDTKVIEANGQHIVPGLIDGHMHVESTMLSVTEFSKAALAKGTTTVFMDPHEIANVFGIEGVRYMHEEGQQLPLKVYTTFPSCVPATDDLEDAGASLTVADIKEGLTWDNVQGLGEVMNFPGVVHGDNKMHGELAETIKAGKTVTGHFPSEDPYALQAYIAAGVTSDHETIAKEDALAKLRAGLHVQIREGSAWRDVKEVIKVITEYNVDTRNISLVTDDVYPETLITKGHMNHVVRRAIEEGLDPVTAIQLATINSARYFHMENDIGSISAGKFADLLIIEDLQQMEASLVVADGSILFEKGELQQTFPAYTYPDAVRNSVHLGREMKADDFLHRTDRPDGDVLVNVVKAIEGSARTEKMTATLQVQDGTVQIDKKQDIIHLACIDRHKGTGQISNVFVHGFQFQHGAVASTVAHDSHNLLVMGVDREDMAIAANRLAEIGGGLVAVRNGEVLAELPMPIAGLMSDQPLETVVEQVSNLVKAWENLGCGITDPIMTFSLIALAVIPEIRVTNRGLADVTTFELIDVVISD